MTELRRLRPGERNWKLRSCIAHVLVVTAATLVFTYTASAKLEPFKASPDQVLVLYNADYEIDVDGSQPGQDSREVAEYYVKMHTDPETGKKPHLMGLTCVHDSTHLNEWKIEEVSQDNKDGVVFVGNGVGPKAGEWIRDSKKVEIQIDPKNHTVDWDTVEFWCRSADGRKKKVKDLTVSGMVQKKNRKFIYPDIDGTEGRCFRFNGHQYFSGTMWVSVKAENMAGKLIRDFKVKYYDIDDFRSSIFGADGIVDEKHLQEDVIIPIKYFLEADENRLEDGTLLRDHILYMVICHGLPFACEGVFGIERGVTSHPRDHGDLASLGQRLQTLYYGWGTAIMPPVISMYMSTGPGWKNGVRSHRITSAMRYPLTGKRWNPYMHPDTYSFLRKNKTARYLHLPVFPDERKQQPPFLFAYGVSRIDGQGPREAKRIIDYSLYASRHLTPGLEESGRTVENVSRNLEAAEKNDKWGWREIEQLGFNVVSKYGGQGIPFLKRPSDNAKDSKKEVQSQKIRYAGYYPGGMDRTIASSNGWNMGRSAPIWEQIGSGVTVSACGGPAYGGGPHITNATFWDNRILMRYLFRGRDLGECFLRSTLYVNWSTSLVGDPLYHPDLQTTVPDTLSPKVNSRKDISITLAPAMGKYTGTMKVDISSSKEKPEVCLLSVTYGKKGHGLNRKSSWPIYSTRPVVILRDLEPESDYVFKPVLTDPYGNTTDLAEKFGRIIISTGDAYDPASGMQIAKKRKKAWEIDLFKLDHLNEKGTVQVEFSAGRQGLLPSIESDGLYFKATPWPDKRRIKISYRIGGPRQEQMIASPLEKGDKATIILRWRKFPLTREILLKNNKGHEFTIAADVRTPWTKITRNLSLRILSKHAVEVHSSRITDDAPPASKEAVQIDIVPVKRRAFLMAHSGD